MSDWNCPKLRAFLWGKTVDEVARQVGSAVMAGGDCKYF